MTTDPEDHPIESLRNLGLKSGECLRDVAIHTIADLRQVGPVVAYRLVQQQQSGTSLNLLWAMAAGLKGKDWRELSEVTKRRLGREAEEN